MTDADFLKTAIDISGSYCKTDEKEFLPDHIQAALTNLLNYCREENIEVVFVLSAQYRDELTMKRYNTMIDQIKEFEFPLINEIDDFDEIGLDAQTDFYNANHTNIHGALKITDYLAQYLVKNYNFPQKTRGYESWEEAYALYSEIIRPYLREDELKWLN